MTQIPNDAVSCKALRAALAIYDKAAAECPFAKSPYPPSDKPCPKCRAESNEGCREENRKAYAFIATARKVLTEASS